MKKAIVAFVMVCLSLSGKSADLHQIVQDTQRVMHEKDRLTLVWWVPTEYWDAAMSENPRVTPEVRARFCKVVEPYLIFAVVSADMGPLGGMTPKDRATLEANTELVINGKPVAPLSKDQISPDALNFVTMMKPMLANMLGQVGKGMEFFVYPNPPRGAKKLVATKPGSFSYRAFGKQLDWRLPLGSLMPPKMDPKTKQVFRGDYLYNPYTGDKLMVPPVESGATNAAALHL